MKKPLPVYRYPELKTANQTLRQALASSPPEAFDSLHATTAGPVGPDSLFCVREGISAEEALVHVSLLLKCAEEVSDEITERGSGLERGLIWSMVHSVEMARAVVDALLDGRGAR
ncbi:DUF6124 family protein [Pseudomonas chlororaphis]|uniref:DUF6124 family protein n=1 Tax=Pseudomonas chlororaphis TaxID=587753 RepID=UPI000F54EB56|nr:DUF3077 domain-containing protein [Pseudomonas chlororaphis]AZD49767.1 hypothetical protein C4K20_4366 [Pseudomonas chlororaphis subsp. aurantiaca]AZD56076.1 hypothetical protein C4K19_4303 [Pseudomonas chlororaphis subsp. aurantiaca]